MMATTSCYMQRIVCADIVMPRWCPAGPMEEACVNDSREDAVEVELLVHSGERPVECGQLGEPEARVAGGSGSRWQQEGNWHRFQVETVVTSSGLSTGKVEQVSL